MNKYYKIYPISRDEANVEVKLDTNYNLNHLDVKTLDNLIGVLDLLGFEDKTEEDNDYVMPEMKAMETDFMELSNINDYAHTKDIVKLLNNADKRIAKLEKNLEFTTKIANELIEIKHKLEQELAELKEKAIVPRFKRQEIVYCFSYGKIQLFNVVAYLDNQITVCENRKTGKLEFIDNDYLYINEQEALNKLKEI